MATSSAARDFDGSGDYLDTSDSSTYNFTSTDHTILAWVYPDAGTSLFAIAGNQPGPVGQGWAFRLFDTDRKVIYTKFGVVDMVPTTVLGPASEWSAIGAAVDVSASADFISLSTTGGELTETESNGSNINSSSASLKIGQTRASTDEFNGAISHVQVFNRKLNNSEMKAALWAPGSVTNGLIGYWPMYGQLSGEPDLSTTSGSASVVGTGGTRNEACPAIPLQMPIM